MNPELANRVRHYTTHTPTLYPTTTTAAGTGVRMDTIGSRECAPVAVMWSPPIALAHAGVHTAMKSTTARDARQSRNGDGRCMPTCFE